MITKRRFGWEMGGVVTAGCVALTAARVASAQGCIPTEHPWFEFQVQQPAEFAGDTTVHPHPAIPRYTRRADSSAFIVQFVVDTLGRPDPRSLKGLRIPADASLDEVRAVFRTWVFTPAIGAGCKVPQLVQTAVER